MSRDIIDKKEKKEKRSLYCSSTVVLASCGCSRCCCSATLAAVAPAVAGGSCGGSCGSGCTSSSLLKLQMAALLSRALAAADAAADDPPVAAVAVAAAAATLPTVKSAWAALTCSGHGALPRMKLRHQLLLMLQLAAPARSAALRGRSCVLAFDQFSARDGCCDSRCNIR